MTFCEPALAEQGSTDVGDHHVLQAAHHGGGQRGVDLRAEHGGVLDGASRRQTPSATEWCSAIIIRSPGVFENLFELGNCLSLRNENLG